MQYNERCTLRRQHNLNGSYLPGEVEGRLEGALNLGDRLPSASCSPSEPSSSFSTVSGRKHIHFNETERFEKICLQ